MARLDKGWHKSPKILQSGLAAMGLHAWSISYSDDVLSDGFIPMGAWPSLRGVRVAVEQLVAAGLWVPGDGGYWLHDYFDYNKSKAEVTAIQAAMRANGRAGGMANARANGKQT
jgi:hypothetical protein